jgi:hypothetical protein
VRRIPRALTGGLFLVGTAVALALVFLGQGGARPVAAQPPPDPHYKCYDIAGPPPDPAVAVALKTQFGVEPEVAIGAPAKLCLPAGKNDAPIPPGWPNLKCYTITGQDPSYSANLETQFGVENKVIVGQATLLCIPAAMTITPAPPEPTPPPPDRHWECFNIAGSDPQDVVKLETQFGVELGVAVGQATKLCAPALKNGEGSLGFPHLKCYNITGDPPQVPLVNLTTQFGIEAGIPVGPPSLLCAPAIKTAFAVGGVAQLPAASGASSLAEESGGLSAGAYAAMIAGVAGAALVLSAGAVYARRRWLK